MTTWELIRALVAAARDPERIGDVAAYKAALTARPGRPAVERALDAVRGRIPDLGLAELRALPPGSLGHEYARFLDANGLQIITPSAAVPRELLERAALVVRYGVVHDMFHVLTGFDASWPGEVGVWAFVGGQRYSAQLDRAAWTAMAVAPLRAPLRIGEAWRSWQAGWAMGERAAPVIAAPLEDLVHEPLDAVRAQLGIVGAGPGYVA